jgi:phospholipid/cholesterol/gamma-HCH transport system substrate-binding protein
MFKPTDKKNYLISGIFISILLVIVAVTISMLNKQNPLFSSRVYIKTEVKNAQNLKEGAAVQLKGIKVGSITSIEFKNLDTLVINLAVNSEYREWIKKDSFLQFKTQGVLGDKFLEILGGSQETQSIEEGDSLVTNEGSQIDHIITKSEDLIVTAGSILTKMDKILGSVESGRFDRVLSNLENVTGNANKTLMTINNNGLSQSVMSLKTSSESLAKVTKRIEEGPGTLHALIYDQTLHEDLKTLLGGANRNKVMKYFIRESIKKGEPAN